MSLVDGRVLDIEAPRDDETGDWKGRMGPSRQLLDQG
jgi:hypothetical protein